MNALRAVPDAIVSTALWGAGLAWMGAMLPPLTLAQRQIPADRLERWTRVYTRGQVALTLCRWQATVDPAVDPDRAYLFVQNHVNVFDHCTAYAATPHFKQGIELASHHRIPVYGPFMASRGTIPVDRSDPSHLLGLRRAMRASLDAGHSLIAFPEGTRTRTGRVGPFHPGLFHVARSLKVDVVPIAVTGMHAVQPTGSWRMRPFQTVHVHVLAPRPTAGLRREDVPAFADEVRAAIAALVDPTAPHAPEAP